jgi:hypothetical protein
MAKFVPESPSLNTPHIIADTVHDFSRDTHVQKFSRAEKYEARAPPVLI